MEHEHFDHERLAEAMECCRPGSNDLFEPAWRRWPRPWRWTPIWPIASPAAACRRGRGGGLRDVPVPAALADRCWSGLPRRGGSGDLFAECRQFPWPAGAGSFAGRHGAGCASPTAAAAAVLARRRGGRPAPSLAALVGGGDGGAGCGGGAVGGRLDREPPCDGYTPLAVLEQATEFFRTESPQTGMAGRQKFRPRPPIPISNDVLRTPQIRWRTIRGLFGRSGVAYDLSAPGAPGRRCTWFPRRSLGCRATAPRPRPTTAGCSAAAWQQGGLLYVLVVEGGPGVYRSCLRVPSGPAD